MRNQPVRYSHQGSSAAAALAGVLIIAIAAGVLVGTASLLAIGVGLLSGNASVASLGPAHPGQTVPAGSTAHASGSPDGGSPGSHPTPNASAPGSGTLDPPPGPGPFSQDLYRAGAFVSELKPINCVPAAMQTMINIMDPGLVDRTRATQLSLYRLARSLSGANLVGAGAEPEGWAAGLNQLGYGPYAVDVEPTRLTAVAKAALALRMTGRPVGLLAWRGAHSWVMSGFTATADPGYTADFTVTAINVEDVWYPAISSIWGPSFPPDTLDPVAKLGIDYLPWRRPTHAYPDKDGRFVLVLPTAG